MGSACFVCYASSLEIRAKRGGFVIRIRTLIAIAVAFNLIGAAPANAARKPWDIARFSACVSRDASNPLDPQEVITTKKCSQVDRADRDVGGLSDIWLDKYLVLVRNKTGDRRWVGGWRFVIDYARFGSSFGGNPAAGFAGFDRITILWPDGLAEVALLPTANDVPSCGSGGSGLMSYSKCSYREVVSILVTPEVAAKFAAVANLSSDPIPAKLFARDGSSFEITISPAEVAAIWQAATAMD